MMRGLILITAIVWLFVAVGCGDDNGNGANDDGVGVELTLEAYFQDLEALATTFDERGQQLDLEALANAEGDEAIELVQQVTSETASVVGDFADGLRELEPPGEADEAHEDAVDVGEDLGETMDEFAEDAADIETADEAIALRDEFVAAFQEFAAFSQACTELQAIADENDIQVDLRCG